MITKILLLRHGWSVANEKDIFGGITDYPLAEKGFKQVERLTNRLKDIKIDEIYSSPLTRAKQTVTPIAKLLNKQIKIEDGITEMYIGEWEGLGLSWKTIRKDYAEITDPIDSTYYYVGMPGQESTEHVAKRMVESITNIAKENAGKTVVLASHAVAIRTFLAAILDFPFEETRQRLASIQNTSICFIEYDSETNKFQVTKQGDNLHNE